MEDQNFIDTVLKNKESDYNFRERRHSDWTDNYTLYRDKVMINQLTQRQSANVSLMKYSIQTLLKDVDDPPMLYFNNRDNDTQKEVFYNEYWKYRMVENKLIIKDIIDKKQVFLFGRSFKKLNIVDGQFSFEIIDPQDMLVNRYVDPASLDSARHLCQEHIFRPLSSLVNNPLYDKDAINRLKEYYATEAGLLKAEDNARSFEEKNERMEQLGLIDVSNPELGEVYVELNEDYLFVYDEKLKRDIIIFSVIAEGKEKLFKKPLHEFIGKTTDDYWMDHFPYTSWGSDPERSDFWSDGIGDIIRTPNKILNSWISQMVENRTLRNFGMNYYDSTVEDFVPQTFEPVAWGWYPFPGNPNEGIKRVDIPDLSESLDEMQFILTLAEKATAATSTQQGSIEPQKVTLGEIQLALANAKERVKSLAILYTDSWLEFGTKYIKFLEAAGDMIDPVKIYKKGAKTSHIYSEEVAPKDWESASGYGCEVKDLSNQAGQTADTLQKLNYAKSLMPVNEPLNEIIKQRALEFAELNANEVKDVMDAEKKVTEMGRVNMIQPGMGGGTPPQPGQPVV